MSRHEPDLHELLRPPHDALLLLRLSRRLRLLEKQGETATARQEIDAALALPWWGLRQLAIRAIGSWRGKPNRAWLTERARRPSLNHRALWDLPRGSAERWQQLETVTCREAVLPMLDAKDADWILDLWFGDYAKFDGLHGALGSLPAPLVEQRLERELADGDRARVEAAIWLLFHVRQIADRDDVYRRLMASPDAYIAKLARSVVALEERSARAQATRAVRTASRRPG